MAHLTFGPNPLAVIQQISSGGTATGVAPGSAVDISYPMRYIYAAAADGGLFDFASRDPLTLANVELALGGQTAWKLAITDGITDATANDVVFATGTTETSAMVSPRLYGVVLPGQKIRFTATGTASKAWRLTCKVALLSNEQGLYI